MSAVIVLGMHRSGTSLVASMLQDMGVFIGDELIRATPLQPHGHYEDVDFVQLNRQILKEAGGHWSHAPATQDILGAYDRMKHAITAMIDRKRQQWWWGWKDPRNCLTIPLYHKHLDNPHYVVVRRDKQEVIDSLTRRDGPGRWGELYDLYNWRVEQFLESVDAPVCRLRYEDLTHPKAAVDEVCKLADFLEMDVGHVERALDCIAYRDRWGFGRLGIGVPYFNPPYDWWRWWSWVLATGLRNGDVFLNDHRIPGEVPIPLAHNAIVRAFLESDADTLCIVENDHVGEDDVIEQMRSKAENQEFDIVCASYTNRRNSPFPAQMPVGAMFEGYNFDTGEYGCTINPFDVAETGTQEYDCAALGLVLIRRWILEHILDEGDPEETFWFQWVGRNSQDVQFYGAVKELGARVGVDRDARLGHIGRKTYTMDEFYQERDKAKEEVQNDG